MEEKIASPLLSERNKEFLDRYYSTYVDCRFSGVTSDDPEERERALQAEVKHMGEWYDREFPGRRKKPEDSAE